ncbi:MAG: hypothetical protein V4541_04595 [Bacteroidota bacterium]
MKSSIFLATLVACFALGKAQAQTVNGVRLSELKSDYIEISEVVPVLGSKLWISLEYGQKPDGNSTTLIKDDNGKNLEFNSLVDGLNKLKGYGYELFQAYSKNRGAQTDYKYYILKKKQ